MRNRAPLLRDERTAAPAFAPELAAVLEVSRLDRRWEPRREGTHILQETDPVADVSGIRSQADRTDSPAGGAYEMRPRCTATEILRRLRAVVAPLARDQGVLLITTGTTRSNHDIDVAAVVNVLTRVVVEGICHSAATQARVVVSVRPGRKGGLVLVVRDTGTGEESTDPHVTGLVTALGGRLEVARSDTGTRTELRFPAAGRVRVA